MRQVIPPGGAALDPGAIYDDLAFPEGADGRPYVVVNVVSTVDGKAAIGGRAYPIGSRVDHLAMRKIRAAADAVLFGAGTLRREDVDPTVPEELAARRRVGGRPAQPLAVLLSGSGDVPLERRFFAAAGRFQPVALLGAEAPAERAAAFAARGVRCFVAPERQPSVSWVVATLWRELGVRRLLVEGGPAVNASFFAAGLVDELFLTLAPKVVGGAALTIVTGAGLPRPARLALRSAFEHESELFLRYAVLLS